MSEAQRHTFRWWLKTGGQIALTTAVTFAPEILRVFPEHTLIFKLALPIGFAIKLFAMKADYQKDTLPSGMTKLMDRIPNSITGDKGSNYAE